MNSAIVQLEELYSQLKSWYELALDLGDNALQAQDTRLEDIADQRHRILNKTGLLQQNIATIKAEMGTLNASEQAHLEAFRQSILDLLPKFEEQEYRMNRVFNAKIKEERTAMNTTSTQLRVARAYMGASTAKRWH